MRANYQKKMRSLFSTKFRKDDRSFCVAGKSAMGCFWLCDRATSKKCDRFFQLSLEKAIVLF